ncbi:hypothetical protein [Streptomyces sp. JJ38]|uniref:hypothetical protein n=1 Tax=Streptomyces sp. JJ38 TaxID=2738128 RepID=UPI001C55FBE5|nr:hypothetical protein [Streptomyces sp. JJ38]MBW1597403.1 hypothetical protein [Streptomyces sp. JJ38]
MKKRFSRTELESVRRVSTVVDVEGSSRRTHTEQIDVQDRLDWLMGHAFRAAELEPRRCFRQNQGDGLLFVLPVGISEGHVVPGLVSGVQTALHGVNGAPGVGGRLRMRMALTEGIVTVGPTGFVGTGVNEACAMVDSTHARDALKARTDCDLVFLVDEPYFRNVVDEDFTGLSPAGFRRVTVPVKSGKPDVGARISVIPPARTNEKVPVFTEEALAEHGPRYLAAASLFGGAAAAILISCPPSDPGGKRTPTGSHVMAGRAGFDPTRMGPDRPELLDVTYDDEEDEHDEYGNEQANVGSGEVHEEYGGDETGADTVAGLDDPFAVTEDSSGDGRGPDTDPFSH